MVSIPPGVWTWGSGEIAAASEAHNLAVRSAADHLGEQCSGVRGHGVVGVRVEVEVQRHHVDVELTGTAVRPVQGKDAGNVFVSDLSARDFTLLHNAGWGPIGLAFGASFVYAPRRSVGTTMRQSSQNVELTNFTEAMYSAREAGMEHMQRSALDMGAQGIVAVRVAEGPMWFATPRHRVHGVGDRRASRGRVPPVPAPPGGAAPRRRHRRVRGTVAQIGEAVDRCGECGFEYDLGPRPRPVRRSSTGASQWAVS